MSAQVDETTVRQFLEIINAHAAQVINGAGPPGVLQLCRIHPDRREASCRAASRSATSTTWSQTAIGDASAGHNVYIEAAAPCARSPR